MLDAIILGLITGFAVAQLANWLDFAMDYGHFLGKLRLNRAWKTAKKTGNVEQLEMEIQGTVGKPPDQQVSRMDRAYWDLSRFDAGLKLWLCKYCFGSRFSLVASITGCVIFWLTFGALSGLIFFTVSNSFFWYIINK